MKAADLFCGAGGTSAGAEASGAVKLVFALNHWNVAIETHAANFPQAKHVNSRLDMTHPSECPKIDLLFASPECTHHSNARGGRPMEDQKRAGAWDVAKWVEHHRPSWVVIENVREFRDWGPLNRQGRPIQSHKGKTFDAWLMALQSLGYKVEYQLLNAADYGAATSRNRLFVIARKGKRSPVFPNPTHAKNPQASLFDRKPLPWRAAAEVIDWSIPCPSIFTRKRPLADKTLRRIEMGLRKFVGPFVGQFRGPKTGDESYGVFDADRPIPTILSSNNHGVVVPFQYQLIGRGAGRSKGIDEAVPTIVACRENHGLVVPYTIKYHGGNKTGRDGTERQYSPGDPLQTLDTQNRFGLVAPYVVKLRNNMDSSSIEDPTGTITAGGGHHGLAMPFLLQRQGFYDCQRDKMPKDIDSPLPVTTANHKPGHLVVPYIADVNHGDDGRTGDRVYSAADPLGSATTKRGKSLIVPFLTSYYGNDQFSGIETPVPTITTKDRHCLVHAEMAPHVPDWRAIHEWESEGGSNCDAESNRIVNTLLQLMEMTEVPGLVIFTTNFQKSLDSALFRRFDSVIRFDNPGPEERRRLIDTTVGRMQPKSFNLDALAEAADGLSAALTINACSDAMKNSILQGANVVTSPAV